MPTQTQNAARARAADALKGTSRVLSQEVMNKLDGDIVAAKTEVEKYEAQLTAAKSKLAKLVTAREVIAGYGGGDNGARDGRRTTLADRIEQMLVSKGPSTSSEIHKRLVELNVGSTQAAINTTLTRMKTSQRVTNKAGRWEAAVA